MTRASETGIVNPIDANGGRIVGPVERIFGVFLVVMLFAVGGFFAMKNDLLSGPSFKKPKAQATTANAAYRLTDKQMATPCDCFEAAFKSSAGIAVTSPNYRSGFLRCRNLHGSEGGRLWTAGWEARQSGLGGRKGGCKAFLKS